MPDQDDRRYRPCLCHADVWPGGNAALIHMGREYGSYGVGAVAACGSPVWRWADEFLGSYQLCPACIAAAGFDPRPAGYMASLF